MRVGLLSSDGRPDARDDDDNSSDEIADAHCFPRGRRVMVMKKKRFLFATIISRFPNRFSTVCHSDYIINVSNAFRAACIIYT